MQITKPDNIQTESQEKAEEKTIGRPMFIGLCVYFAFVVIFIFHMMT